MQPTFSTGDLVKATGVPRSAFQTWMRRDDISFHTDHMQGGDGAGNHRRFSFAALLHFAVGVELVRIGLPASTSFQAAVVFSYLGQYAENGLTTDSRPPAFPFHYSKGKSLLIIPAGEANRAQVIGSENGAFRLSDVIEANGGCTAFITLDLSEVFARTLRALDMDPEAELRTVYGEAA